MRTLPLEHDYGKSAAKLRGKFPHHSHVEQVIVQDTTVIAPNGNTVAVLLTRRIDPELYRLADALWSTVEGLPSNRTTAMGTRSLSRSVNREGAPSPRTGINVRVLDVLKKQGVRQGILGCLGRPCRQTTLSLKRPELLDANRRLTERVDKLYSHYTPTHHARQRARVKKTPHCRLWRTAFSTIYVLKNGRTAYHPDGHLRGLMTAIIPMGKFAGGELVLPRWRIAIAYQPGDLLLFDAEQLHGNLPFEGERLSAAFYCARHIAYAGNGRADLPNTAESAATSRFRRFS